jgi:hypothetical protein
MRRGAARRRRRTPRIVLGSLAVVTMVGVVQNLDELERWRHWRDEGSMIPTVPGCPDYEPSAVPVEPDPTSDGAVAAQAVAHVESSAHADLMSVNPWETARQVVTLFDHPLGRFESRYSGIEFRFYSDRPDPQWELDPVAFDDAFHVSLTVPLEHADPEIAHVLDCLRQRIVVDDEFAGEHYDVFISGEPNACLANGRIIHPSRPQSPACQQSGFTPPKIDVHFLFWHAVEEQVMVLTTGNYDPAVRDRRATRLVAHEAMHAMLTLTDTPLRLHPDEQWVRYHERRLADAIAKLDPALTY